MDTIPTLIAGLKPQTHHNSMLVKNHILLFMLKDKPHPSTFPFLLFFSAHFSSSKKNKIIKNPSASIHTHTHRTET